MFFLSEFFELSVSQKMFSLETTIVLGTLFLNLFLWLLSF
jgi:hypothetical protein